EAIEIMRELVRIRVLAAEGRSVPTSSPSLAAAAAASPPAPNVFARVIPQVDADITAHRTLAMPAYRALLVHANRVRHRAKTDDEYEDALEGAARAIQSITSLLLSNDGSTDGSGARTAFSLLRRATRLPFARDRQRAFLQEAAMLCSEESTDPSDHARA